MRVYLSHSKRDYGTSYIWDVKERLLRIYGEETFIVDPAMHSEDCISEEDRGGFLINMVDIFYPLIKECDVVVAVPDKESGKYTGGVVAEMRYAKRNEIEVWEM